MKNVIKLERNVAKSEKNAIKLEKIDFCKGIGISLIFSNHLFHNGDNIFNRIGWQGVHIFIVLSGFGLTYSCLSKNFSDLNPKQWLIQRLKRILPTYWITCSMGFLFILLIKINKLPAESKWMSKDLYSHFNMFISDLLMIKNFNFTSIFHLPNGHLWFIPFILSFYLVFPFLYKTFKRNRILNFIVVTILIEFFYRAISIYILDGVPISYREELGLSHIPDVIIFQKGAPFGFFPSRLGEFSLGMLGAYLFVNNQVKLERILFRFSSLIIGSVFLLIGNLLRFKVWGWIFSDYLIALGLILVSLNIANFMEKRFVSLFKIFVNLGIFSYYIYLVHLLAIQIFDLVSRSKVLNHISGNNSIKSGISILGILLLTYLCTYALKNIDQKISNLSFSPEKSG
jgi:peptidoglycan/LPS O-acetylase OafA/YrhL